MSKIYYCVLIIAVLLIVGCQDNGPAIAKRIYVADDSSGLTGCKLYRIRDPNYSSAVVMRCPQESIPVEQQTVTIDGVEYQRIKR